MISNLRPICGISPPCEKTFQTEFVASKYWKNGSVIPYHYYQDSAIYGKNAGTQSQINNIDIGLKKWTSIGIGVSFREVKDPSKAFIRIAFDSSGNNESRIGIEALLFKDIHEPTMNFANSDNAAIVLHEIGHSLGLEHEHQNPACPLQFNKDAVREHYLGKHDWDDDKIEYNIYRKISSGKASPEWDEHSIMGYEFPEGLIDVPKAFRGGLFVSAKISDADKHYIRALYPSPVNIIA